MKKLLIWLVSLCGATGAAGGAASPSLEDFAGLWEVVPTSRRTAAPAPRDGSGQPLGVAADAGDLTAGDRRVRRIMTDAGRAAFDALDPSDLPANNCRSPGLPSIAMAPNLQLWALDGETLRITHEYFGTKREIHLGEAAPSGGEKTAAGYATGHLDGDALTITTTDLAAMPGGLSRSAPSSDERVVTERYRLQPDGDALEGELTLRDAAFLTRDIQLTVRLRRPEPGTELVLFPCDIEASRRHLDP